MKFSEKWLREWVNPDFSTDELCHEITMAGLEVDAVNAVAPEHSGVVVGKILTVKQHPDADKLQICEVDVGEQSTAPLKIVCGAANARSGIKVACAMINAKLPGNFKIKKSKLRGVESYGMLCSEKELGLAENADGIMELADNAPLGQTLIEYYGLEDHSIEIGLTPNRSDCLSIEGMARDIAVITGNHFQSMEIVKVPATIKDQISVTVSASEQCPRYACRIIKGINSQAKSPLWLVEKLRRSDVRSLSLIVDITNYVMLELGQPMHAFDCKKISGALSVRLSENNEQIALLDGQNIKLDAECLLIADEKGPLALAGIMGGESSSVTEQTEDIILESAYFDAVKLAGKARTLGLHTDSSHRFERGVSPALQERAIERATQLIIEMGGGEAGPVVVIESQKDLPCHLDKQISFKLNAVKKLLGLEISEEKIEKMFLSLEMKIEKKIDHWLIIPPAFRFDINIEADLIEEIARLYGYDNLPLTRLCASISMQEKPENRLSTWQICQQLIALDYQEVINYSFVDPAVQKLINPTMEKIILTNPISEDLSQMRSSLWTGLLKNLVFNQNRQQNRVRLFEMGSRFIKEKGLTQEINSLAAICSGNTYPEQWGIDSQKIDFFDVKADLENLLYLGGNSTEYRFVAEKHPALHPGQTARVYRADRAIGWIGTLHPHLITDLQLKQNAILFEINLDEILITKIPGYSNISKYQANRRDIALIVDKSCSSLDLIETIRDNGGRNLKNVLLFDTYTSDLIDAENKKSLAIGLTIQAEDKTLTDEEIDSNIHDILSVLKIQHGAKLRD